MTTTEVAMMQKSVTSFSTLASIVCLAGVLGLASCGHSDDAPQNESTSNASNDFDGQPGLTKGVGGIKADASVEAVFLDFDFSAELVVERAEQPEKRIEDQLLYTVGQLNGERAVGRLDKLELRNVEVTEKDDGFQIAYDATLLVAWGKKDNVPDTYRLKLPRKLTDRAKRAFVDKYAETCVSYTAHDVSTRTMWYYFRPNADDCELDAADVVEAEADVSVSKVNTTGAYPEYHKVWEDDLLKVTAVFGKDKADATTNSDPGIAAYNEFDEIVRRRLEDRELSVEPADAPSPPGTEVSHLTYRATLASDREVEIHALLVDNVRDASPEFDQTYARLTRDSDLVAYNGHAGLGANIRAMARKGDWKQGQYTIVYMDGCDTYAYVDSALADAHARVNPDDDTGTKYLDLIMNAMPAHFRNNSDSTMALIWGLMQYDAPRTYERIFERISPARMVLVSGERDNEFVPGMLSGNGDANREIDHSWDGMTKEGSVARDEKVRYETPTLAAGTYRFEMSGDGDPDLFVRIGKPPAYNAYDCRPKRHGPRETCEVELPSPAPIHIMVRGGVADGTFKLEGSVEY